MTLRVGGCRVRAHPLLPVLLIAGAVSGMGERLAPSLAALALHEAGHLLLARWFRLRIDELEITPLQKDAKIYIEKWPEIEGDSVGMLTSVSYEYEWSYEL